MISRFAKRHAGCPGARCAFVEAKAQRDGRDRGRAFRADEKMREELEPQMNTDERGCRGLICVHPCSSVVSNSRSLGLSAPNKMHPNAPQHTQMHPQNANRQNEPTMAQLGAFGCISPQPAAPAVDTGLRQLTPVNPGLPAHAIWQNEPTDSPTAAFSARARLRHWLCTSSIRFPRMCDFSRVRHRRRVGFGNLSRLRPL